MASILVHVGFAGLIAAALLGRALDWRAAVVLAATAATDLDVFVGLVLEGTHRAAFHTFLLPALAAGLVYYDVALREESLLERWRPDAGRVAGVAIVAVAGIGVDMVINGVNAFWPLHDQFYTVDGKALLSNQRGFVQTFVETEIPEPNEPPPPDEPEPQTTNNTHYETGVDPAKGEEPETVERTFPLARSGWQLLLGATGYVVLGFRLWEQRNLGEENTASARDADDDRIAADED
jgi:hypothetical protein